MYSDPPLLTGLQPGGGVGEFHSDVTTNHQPHGGPFRDGGATPSQEGQVAVLRDSRQEHYVEGQNRIECTSLEGCMVLTSLPWREGDVHIGLGVLDVEDVLPGLVGGYRVHKVERTVLDADLVGGKLPRLVTLDSVMKDQPLSTPCT